MQALFSFDAYAAINAEAGRQCCHPARDLLLAGTDLRHTLAYGFLGDGAIVDH